MENEESAELRDVGAPEGVRRFIADWMAKRRKDEELEAKLTQLVRIVLETAGRMNLTGDRQPDLFWKRHVADAIQAAQVIEEAIGPMRDGARVLDVGSGAGLPGLVWALLWPAARVELLEARQKRANFMQGAAAALGLANVRVHCGRAETLGHDRTLREAFDLVGARAVAALPALLELTLPFARLGGHVAAIKSAGIDDEIKGSKSAAKQLGGGNVAAESYERQDGKACVVCLVRKERATPAGFPRAEGVPERKPL